ncbi:hypothetical protein EON65_28755 [archaeon]|nr:MAG: hypothetical protein EON65_28755 [archaeon]
MSVRVCISSSTSFFYSIICLLLSDIFESSMIDELIRQITINCAERGLLLLRVRDEARMTITAYETLYESSIAYGVRKALVAEQKKIDLVSKIKGMLALPLSFYATSN